MRVGEAGAATPFVGRDDELRRVHEALPRSRLVTVVGPPGVGKTRLAREAVASFPDAAVAVVVELAGLVDADAVEPALLAAFPVQPPRTSLDDLCRSDPDAIFLLDNCEHLSAAAAAAATEILHRTTRAVIVATSRRPLGLAAESVLPLDPLPQSAAAALFLDRARRHDLRFEPDERAAAVIDRICARVDRLPLAVELAAAQLRALGLEELERRLDDQLQFLRAPGGGGPGRQTALEAALEWGYCLLPPDQRLLLSRLSIFSTSFSLDAAQAICSDGALPPALVYPALTGLVESSYVAPVQHVRLHRFRLLEPIRQFALRKLAPVGPRPSLPAAVFRKDARQWLVGDPARPARLEPMRGLEHLAALLRAPGREIPAVDLVGGAVTSGDTGPLIDDEAAATYRRRLAALDEDKERARRRGDAAAEDRAEEERAAILHQLRAATGLGGRSRRATNSETERARTTATKAIRAAIGRIASVDPGLGEHLGRAVRTGTYCSYAPDDGGPEWLV